MWVNGDYNNTSQSSQAYAQHLANAGGVSVNSIVDQSFYTNPNVLQAQANWEAGKTYPMSSADLTSGIAQGLAGGTTPTGASGAAGSTAQAGSGGWMDWLGHQFVRGMVVMLGLVFVAGGLGMFAIGTLANPEGLAQKAAGLKEGRLRRKSMETGIKQAEMPHAPAPAPEITVTNLVRQGKSGPSVSSRRRLLREGKLPPAKKKRLPPRSPEEITNTRLAKAAIRKAKKGAITV
jgi:hypothetical protein